MPTKTHQFNNFKPSVKLLKEDTVKVQIMKIDFVKKWEWMNAYSNRHCRKLFYKTRAALKKAMKNNGCKGMNQVTFQYDPSSYALNFDDGCCCKLGEDFRRVELQRCCHGGKSSGHVLVLVIVLLVNPIVAI